VTTGQQLQENNQQLIQLLSTHFQARREPNFAWKSAVSAYLALPALRAFWPMSSIDYTVANRAVDVSGQGNHLTDNNTPLFNFDSLAPYVEFNGTTQYLNRADGGAANWADITGTETYINSSVRGLTLGCWCYFDNVASADEMLIAKDNIAPNRGYFLRRNAAGTCRFGISVDGAALTSVDSVATIGAATWTLVVGRFMPSASLDVWVNTVIASNLAAIPASIFDSAADLKIGAVRAVPLLFMDGRQSLDFICAAALSNGIILSLFEQTKAMFGVT
jgi:hypothetical protein